MSDPRLYECGSFDAYENKLRAERAKNQKLVELLIKMQRNQGTKMWDWASEIEAVLAANGESK